MAGTCIVSCLLRKAIQRQLEPPTLTRYAEQVVATLEVLDPSLPNVQPHSNQLRRVRE